jgi:hypothetical protein
MYLAVSGTLFTLVALAHVVRAINDWPIQIAQWSVSVEVSWVAAVVTLALAIWALRLFRG